MAVVYPQPLPLVLGYVPGMVDIPDSLFTSGNVFADLLLARLRSNCDFNASMIEVFTAGAYNGDTVALPVSSCTGYQYQDWECFIFGSFTGSYGANGGPSAAGQIQECYSSIGTDLSVHTAVNYYVQGGQFSPTNDGNLQIWVIAQRGWGQLSLAAPSAFTDLADSDFAQDSPVTQTIWRQLNQNCKLIRREFFLNYGVPIATISRGNNLVTCITKTPHNLSIGDPFYVYYCNDSSFNTSGSNVLASGVGLTMQAFAVVSVPNSTTLTWLQQNGADSNSTSGRLMKAQYANGDTLPSTVTSPYDGYVYQRTVDTLLDIPILFYSGRASNHGGPSGGGRLRRLGPYAVNPTTGAVSAAATYYDGSTTTVTTDGALLIATFAERALSGSPPMAAQHTSYNAASGKKYCFGTGSPCPYLEGQQLTDGLIQALNDDAKEAIGRPEFFEFAYGNGTTVPAQSSPLDNSRYSSSQQIYFGVMTDTGDVGTGCLASFQQSVAQTQSFWSPSTYYAVGTQVTDWNGNYQTCVTAGTSENSPPNWPGQWIHSTPYVNTGYGAGASEGQIVFDSNNNQQICITSGTSGGSAPAWNTMLGGHTTDGTVVWQLLKLGLDTQDGPTLVWQLTGVGPGSYSGLITALANGLSGPIVQGVVVCFRS
ncbi:MAG TPA: hypothetical protein VGZ29_05800 [Terriglobia bacterium]|nr:hypothetical protein [Terriglobia bacterium]